MMESVAFDNIPFQIDMEDLIKKLHIKKDSSFYPRVKELADAAQKIGRPKAIYKAAYVDSQGDDYVVLDGIKFTSRILRVNFEGTYRVFPYVVTSGMELEEWSHGIQDMYDTFVADAIKEMVLRLARSKFFVQLDEEYNLSHAANMNPGSLPEWPISEQKNLFALLGDVKGKTGVELTNSFLMSPIKTVSGIRFPKEGTYENCQLCPRENCPGRKTPYDKNLYENKYKLK